MQLKIERLEEKQEELRDRLKVVEKWVIGAAAVLLLVQRLLALLLIFLKHTCKLATNLGSLVFINNFTKKFSEG
jgi:hypothetical protein